MNTTSTVNLRIGPRKEAGWCKAQGIEHSWKDGPTLTVSPPIQTRECINCGQRQFQEPTQWRDA